MNTVTNFPVLPDFIQTKIDFYLEDLFQSTDDGRHLVVGKKPSANDIVLQSNDYLDLSNHPEIVQCHAAALLKNQNTPFMSGVFLQNDGVKPAVETELAQFTGFTSCLLSQSGWAANTALLQTICDSQTNVYIDFFAHMSLWEGARIAGANIHPFMHNNVRHLKKLVKRNGPGLVIVDSIYSTIGTIAPLEEIVHVARENGCATLVDESHSLGTHGQNGAGLINELGLTKQVDFMTASLAKTFAYRAGAIWCNNLANECIPFVAYPAIFSSAMLPYENDRISKTLEVIKKSDVSRTRLNSSAKYLAEELRKIGFSIRSESQIVSLETGDEKNTEKVRQYLESNGIFGAIFCRPATTPNKNIMRFSLNSSITQVELDRIIEVCKKAYSEPNIYFV
ncbi:CAI-1 autoinducer synthase [Vibrio xiamenensis]|uniref:CAI-1 autoinducer synthase n=1 Tax=Vibrio xiamenensis TaxID=861298 RepID=A0A1G8GYG2_9VIBR|nr:alpha-hydroxyketone-type quorum-sensing autoinducer synthase [Vibrio xiamenensis]SDH99428.1 CAI-1 autoinducer synthase [Vibrio xiamenensis]